MRPSVSVAVAGALREPQPQHVHRRAEIHAFEPGEAPHRRVPAVGADNEIGAHVEMPARELGLETDDAIAIPEEVLDLCLHLELEARIELARDRRGNRGSPIAG